MAETKWLPACLFDWQFYSAADIDGIIVQLPEIVKHTRGTS